MSHRNAAAPLAVAAARRPATLLAAAVLGAALLAGCKTEVTCASDQVTCNGQCVSLASDPANCGACGFACGAGETCSASQCCAGSRCFPAIYSACFGLNQVRGVTAALEAVGAPVPVGSGPISLAWAGSDLWVANSLDNTLDRLVASGSGLARADTSPSVTIPAGSGPFVDLEHLAFLDGQLYVSNAGVSSLVRVDAASGTIRDEVAFDAFANPQGVAFSGTKAYVALTSENQVAVLDLSVSPPVRTKTIDLRGLGSPPDGMAMPFRLAVVGERLYVTLTNIRYVPAPVYQEPAGNGRLAVIDLTTDDLVPGVNPVDLGAACQNPQGIAVRGSTVWVSCGFFVYNGNTVTGAAFVPVLVSGTSPAVGVAVPVTAAAPGALTFCGGTGFAADRFTGDVLRLDPVQGVVSGRGLVCPAPQVGSATFVSDVTCAR
jgi:hypothetical protein